MLDVTIRTEAAKGPRPRDRRVMGRSVPPVAGLEAAQVEARRTLDGSVSRGHPVTRQSVEAGRFEHRQSLRREPLGMSERRNAGEFPERL